MDPYTSYTHGTNFDSVSTASHSTVGLEHLPASPQQAPQQQLPSFSEILQSQDMGPHDHYSQNLHHGQQDDSRAYHSPSGLRRSGQSSPGSQPGTTAEGFDNMSSRTVEASYSDPRHHRQSPSWTSHAQFSDVLSPPYSQRLQYPRTNLPPIRDVAHGCDHGYQSDVGAYSQPYAPSVVSPNGLETTPYATERPSLYDTTQRYGQNCFQVNRPHPPSQMEYYRFPPPGTPYQTPPYTGLEYSSPSVGVHHPSSPTVCGDTDSRNRRRRGNLPKPVTDILRGWFHDHLDHPYPTEEDKQAFAARTGLTINQISNWFINARRRHLPALRQQRDRSSQMIATDYDSDQLRRTHAL